MASPRLTALFLALALAFAPSAEAKTRKRPRTTRKATAPAPVPPHSDAPTVPDENALFPARPSGAAEPSTSTSGPVDVTHAPAGTATSPEAAAADDETAVPAEVLIPTAGIVVQPLSDTALRDPLQIGGSIYMQGSAELREGLHLLDQPLHVPTFLDGYLDGRPDDRLQGLVKLRLAYDPTVDKGALNPLVLIDQLWLRFDIARKVFITAGVQHLRWGTSRIWQTNDVFHTVIRDPFIPFDARSGTSLVKVHVPVGETGWNVYGVGMMDNPTAARLIGGLGGALRAEATFGAAELGVSAVWRQAKRPRYEVDLSSSLGPVDVYAEATLRMGPDGPLYRPVDPAAPDGVYEAYSPSGPVVAASGGVEWATRLGETNQLTLAAEYAFNSAGYDDARVYPTLFAENAFEPLYVGRHYVAVSAQFTRPGAWDDVVFSLLNVTNLSDLTSNARLGVALRVLARFTAELFAQVHYGPQGGEFRLGQPAPVDPASGTGYDPAFRSYPVAELGIGLSTPF